MIDRPRRAVEEARLLLDQMLTEARSDVVGARRRAEAELVRHLALLRDAIDQALAAGIPWAEIGAKLGLDGRLAQAWLSEA